MTKLVRVRGNSTLVLLSDGKPHVEVRPAYNAGIGPAIVFYRVSTAEPEHLFTLRLASVTALVRKLPIVTAAALRLEAKAKKPAK
jgi:hypothetical protein